MNLKIDDGRQKMVLYLWDSVLIVGFLPNDTIINIKTITVVLFLHWMIWYGLYVNVLMSQFVEKIFRILKKIFSSVITRCRRRGTGRECFCILSILWRTDNFKKCPVPKSFCRHMTNRTYSPIIYRLLLLLHCFHLYIDVFILFFSFLCDMFK